MEGGNTVLERVFCGRAVRAHDEHEREKRRKDQDGGGDGYK